MLRCPERGLPADAAAALRRGHHAARHRGQARHRVPRRADHVDRARQHAGHRAARSLLAAPGQLGRRAPAGGGGGAVREAHRPPPRRRLGHDRDVAGGHRPADERNGQGRVRGPAAARHPDGHRGPRRSAPAAAARREGRDPHQGTQRHPGLLERAAGDGGGVRRRLSADRRHRLHGRGRLLLPGGPQEGLDHLGRLQRLSAQHRGGDLRAPGRGRGDRDRRARQLPRRGRQGVRAAEARRRRLHARGAARLPGRQARAPRDAGAPGVPRRAAEDRGRQAVEEGAGRGGAAEDASADVAESAVGGRQSCTGTSLPTAEPDAC